MDGRTLTRKYIVEVKGKKVKVEEEEAVENVEEVEGLELEEIEMEEGEEEEVGVGVREAKQWLDSKAQSGSECRAWNPQALGCHLCTT